MIVDAVIVEPSTVENRVLLAFKEDTMIVDAVRLEPSRVE